MFLIPPAVETQEEELTLLGEGDPKIDADDKPGFCNGKCMCLIESVTSEEAKGARQKLFRSKKLPLSLILCKEEIIVLQES